MKSTVIAIAATIAMGGTGFAMDSLSQFDWKKRVLIVFGDTSDPKIAQQIEVLESQNDELADRDMVVLQVSGNDVRAVYGKASRIDAARLRSEAKADGKQFEAVLVGKDGGVKLRSSQVVGSVEMFDLIDRMPMRRGDQG